MLEAECSAGFGKLLCDIAGAVVGHHPRNRDAEAFVITNGCLEEYDGADGFFVWEDVGEGNARSIIDADVDVFPANSA